MKSDVQKQRQVEPHGEIFLANRATGRIELVATAAASNTRRCHVFEDGSLRVRFPNAEDTALEAVVVNTAGGVAGGDYHALDIAVKDSAQLVVTTAAAEKIYRSTGPDATIDVKLTIADRARLSWLPQEMILFNRSRISRRIEVQLSGNAAVTVAEMVVFGRSAMGESVERGLFVDRWRVFRDGRPLFAETITLDGLVSQLLAEPAATAGSAAIATVLTIPGDDATADKVRARKDSFSGEVGISAWNGIAVARLCARDAASVRSDLIATLTALGTPLPRLWLN